MANENACCLHLASIAVIVLLASLIGLDLAEIRLSCLGAPLYNLALSVLVSHPSIMAGILVSLGFTEDTWQLGSVEEVGSAGDI